MQFFFMAAGNIKISSGKYCILSLRGRFKVSEQDSLRGIFENLWIMPRKCWFKIIKF